MEGIVSWASDIEFWHWWAIGILLVGIEVFVVGSTVLLGPAAACLLIGVVLLIDPSLDWRMQLLIFAVVAVVATVIFLKWVRRHPGETDHPTLNTRGRSYVGRQLTLTEPLENGRGRIRIDDTWWQATVEDSGTRAAGALVVVADADGATLIVKPA